MIPWTGGDAFDLSSSGAVAAADYALQRFADVDVDVPRENRLIRAQRLLRGVATGEIKLSPEDLSLIRRVTASQWTVLDFYLIARATAKRGPAGHADRIRLALGGAELPEEDSNHLHRNTAFELVVAAFLAMGNIPVLLAEPDLVVRLDSREIGIAAKRVQSSGAIQSRMREARRQIVASELDGLIAVNVDAIMLDAAPTGDVNEKGQSVDEKLAEVHRADDEVGQHPEVLGRVVFARTAHWSFEESRPGLQQDMFRQYRVYTRSEGEGDGLITDLEAAEALVAARLQEL